MAESWYDVRYVARFVVGNPDAEKLPDEAAIGRQTRDLNEALAHGGRIVAQEKNFFLLNIGEHQIVSQYVVYHVGFKRKPYRLPDEEGKKNTGSQ